MLLIFDGLLSPFSYVWEDNRAFFFVISFGEGTCCSRTSIGMFSLHRFTANIPSVRLCTGKSVLKPEVGLPPEHFRFCVFSMQKMHPPPLRNSVIFPLEPQKSLLHKSVWIQSAGNRVLLKESLKIRFNKYFQTCIFIII